MGRFCDGLNVVVDVVLMICLLVLCVVICCVNSCELWIMFYRFMCRICF